MKSSRSSFMLSYTTLAVSMFLVLVVGSVSNTNAQLLRTDNEEAVVENQARTVRPVSIAIEEGGTTPKLLLGSFKGSAGNKDIRPIVPGGIRIPSDAVENIDEVTFTIINGGGKFIKSGDSFYSEKIAGGSIEIPALVSGSNGDEGVIRVSVGGIPIVSDIRLATVPVGSMSSLALYIDPSDEALIASGSGYAVVDENRWRDVSLDSVSQDFTAEGLSVAAPSLGLCIRTPFGPGKVKYDGFSPWAVGKRYSYKPESSSSLKKGSGSSDDVDAVYRYSWGCGTALKVPDSCTLTIKNSGSFNTCCNAAMAALGHTVKWVNPKSHGFPNCPIAP